MRPASGGRLLFDAFRKSSGRSGVRRVSQGSGHSQYQRSDRFELAGGVPRHSERSVPGRPRRGGPAALANILCGAVSPSGKLPVTIARHYEEYPAALDFSWDKEHPEKILTYEEYGLDTAANGSKGFAKARLPSTGRTSIWATGTLTLLERSPCSPLIRLVLYPVSTADVKVEKTENGLSVTAVVKNEGSRSGKEVLQLYSSAFGTETKHPYQELKGIAKTRELACGESETLSLTLPWEELACYQEKDGFLEH